MSTLDTQARDWLSHAHKLLGKIVARQPLAIWFDWTITPGVVTATLNPRTTNAQTIQQRYTDLAEALDLTPGFPVRLGPCETRLIAVGSRDHVDLVVTATLFTSPLLF